MELMWAGVSVLGWLRGLALLGLGVMSLLYCWPGHPSAHGLGLDALAHVALFAGVAPLCWLGVQRWPVALCLMATLGLVLEVVQWLIGGYAQIEWADVAANALGTALGFALSWLGGMGDNIYYIKASRGERCASGRICRS